VAIISVEQGYKSTEERQNYKTESEITYRGRGVPINNGRSKDNYDKDGKPRYFNYNIYRHIVKDCKKPKKEKKTRKCYKCDKVEHLAKYDQSRK